MLKGKTSWYVLFVCQTFLNDSWKRWKFIRNFWYLVDMVAYEGRYVYVWVSVYCVRQKNMEKNKKKNYNNDDDTKERIAMEKSHQHKNYMCILWVDILNRLLSFIKMFFFSFLTFPLFCGYAHAKQCIHNKECEKLRKQWENMIIKWTIFLFLCVGISPGSFFAKGVTICNHSLLNLSFYSMFVNIQLKFIFGKRRNF